VKPISDCLVTDVDGDGKQEVALAKEDGYVLVYDGAGELIRSELVGEPVRAVATVNTPVGEPVLTAALPGRLVRLGVAVGRYSTLAVGEYSKLASTADGTVLLAVGEGAVIDAFKLL